MRNYITLFDRNYLAKGLALYQSLERHSIEDFVLHILPLDAFTRKYLTYQISKGILSKIKVLDWNFLPKDIPEKPIPYNFFLLASEVTLALMKELRKPITYLDADIYFFQDPNVIHDTIGRREVAVIPHRFPAHDYHRLSPNGLYNVSWVYFSNTKAAIDTLQWWNNACREKCDAESCGDQKYLNDFPDRLGDRLCILEDIGIGAGPWNTYTYDINDGPTINGHPLIFYHYHEFKQLKDDKFILTGYPVTGSQNLYIYDPYVEVIRYCQTHIDKKAQEWYA